jgi:DNA-binding winged helix-turn-helix (wHTH) protein
MATETAYSFGIFRLDPQNACVWRDEEMIKVTPKAFAVLQYLVEHPGRIVTKDELFTSVWPETVVSDVALSVCVRELRKSLEDDAKTPQYIETVHRRGFRFVGEVVNREALSTSEQRNDTVMPAQAGIQELQAEASGRPLWIPASAGMTQPSATSQNGDSSPQLIQASDSPTLITHRSWSIRSLLLMGLVLVVSTVLLVHYFLRPTPPPSLPLPHRPSIIVMPFVNLSGDPAQEYFSDGVTEEITATLSRVPGLFVIARTTAFFYKSQSRTITGTGFNRGATSRRSE